MDSITIACRVSGLTLLNHCRCVGPSFVGFQRFAHTCEHNVSPFYNALAFLLDIYLTLPGFPRSSGFVSLSAPTL